APRTACEFAGCSSYSRHAWAERRLRAPSLRPGRIPAPIVLLRSGTQELPGTDLRFAPDLTSDHEPGFSHRVSAGADGRPRIRSHASSGHVPNGGEIASCSRF